LRILRPDGREFATYVELARERDELAQQRDEMAQQRYQLALERDVERLRAKQLAEQLRAMGVDPDAAH
jgi:hypothetical protein